MPPEEEAPQQTVEDTPEAPDAPEGTQETPESVDYAQRYNDLRPEFDRKSQQLSEYEDTIRAAQAGDPEAIQALGFELADSEDPEEEVDFDEEATYDPRVDQLLQEREQQQQQAQQQQLAESQDAHISGEIERLAKSEGVEFTDADIQLIGDLALASEWDGRTQMPRVEDAYKRLSGRDKLLKESWTQGKRQAARAPEGGPGQEKVNLLDDQERRRVMREAYEAADDSG